MSGISSKAAGSLENKKKYNGIEQNEDLDLNVYDAFYRTYDPQIGRWWQIDPKCEAGINSDINDEDEKDLSSLSPYNSMGNDPVRYSDPKGDIFGVDNLIGAVVGAVVEVGTQVVSNAITGQGFKMDDYGWVKVGVAAAEGFVTSGASNLVKGGIKIVGAAAKSAIDNHKQGARAIIKGAAIGLITDKIGGGAANISKTGNKAVQKLSNKVIGSKNQITKNILANNTINAKTATLIAKNVQSAQKSVAKAVREAPKKVKESVASGTADGLRKNLVGE